MEYLREDWLKKYLRDRRLDRGAQRRLLREASEKGDEDVFLSHAHRDEELVAAVVAWLNDHGIRVYVDWMDPEMPQAACAETAARVKKKIGGCRCFLCLITNPALRSTWVPWEIGVGDTLKGQENVYLIPVADPNGAWDGAEFLQLYPAIGPTSPQPIGQIRKRNVPLYPLPYSHLRPDVYAGRASYTDSLLLARELLGGRVMESGMQSPATVSQAAPLVSRPNGKSEQRIAGYTW